MTSDLRQQTAILGSLSELSSMPEAKRLAAVVMITDGRENAAAAD
ncbi:MAG: hypothetical protein U5N86_11755 [Planctomycetota bacterium]|nr:hypothetical protein [Planctomycetota bacterium]